MTDIRLGITLTADGKGLQGEVRLGTEDLNRLAQAADKVGKESNQAATGTDRLARNQRNASQDARRLKNEQRDLGQQLGKTTREVNYLRLAVLALATGVGIRTVDSFIDAASESENLRVRLRFLTDDAEAAGDAILAYAAKVPFTFQQIQQAAPILLGVARDADEFNRILEITGDIAAVSGLTFTETAQQIQRSFSAGINSADLFRERGVRAMLDFEDGVETSAEATREHILGLWEDSSFALNGAAMEMADTWTGLTSMLGDKWFQFRILLMDGAPFEFLKGIAAETNQRLDEEFGSIEEAADRMGIKLVDTVVDVAIGAAAAADALSPVVEGIFDVFDRMISTWNNLDPLVKELGLVGMFMLGWKGRAALAAALAFGDEIAQGAQAYSDTFNDVRGDIREGIGLDREGGLAVRVGPTVPDDEAAALRAGYNSLNPDGAPLSIIPGTDRSLFGSSNTTFRDLMTDFLAGVRENIAASEGRDRPSFGSPGSEGSGSGGEDPTKAASRIDDLLFEIELMERSAREQEILNELRKSGSEATIAQGQSLESFLAGLSEEERALAEVTGRLYDRQQAVEAQAEADERHAEVVADLADRIMELRPPLEQAIFAADRWRTEALAGLDEAAAGYEDFAAQVEEIYGTMLADAYEEDLDNRRDWAAGVEDALREAADAAGNDAEAFKDLTAGVLEEAEDAWVEFAKTGKLSLADLGQFMQDWALRYAFRKLIEPGLNEGISMLAGSAGASSGGSGSFFASLGSLFGSSGGSGASTPPPRFFHTGGSVTGRSSAAATAPGLFAMAQRYHSGGMVLKPGEVPAILKAGEFVSTPEQFDNMGNTMGLLAAIAARQPAASSSGQAPQQIAITMNVHGVTDAESFRRSEGQILSRLQGELSRAGRRQG